MKPFLKWAGGKHKLAPRILATLPKTKTLVEPFVGSGAVFLMADYEHYVLSDINPDLILMYQQIQQNTEEFISRAKKVFEEDNNNSLDYYRLRKEFNDSKNPERRAELFIYLNRYCFNGLCRYNSKGGFNVPFGDYSGPSFPEKEVRDFGQKSKLATFVLQDFRGAMTSVTEDSSVYCDPPYIPKSTTASFTAYSGKGFELNDHKDIRKLAKELQARKIPVLVSNSDTALSRQLYEGDTKQDFEVQRNISSNGNTRNKAGELLVEYF